MDQACRGQSLVGVQSDVDRRFNVDPFRIAVFAEQYSERMDRDYPAAKHIQENPDILAGFQDDDPAAVAARSIRIPSFFVTSLPERSAKKGSSPNALAQRSSVFSAVWHPIASVLLPQFSRSGQSLTRKIYLHHSFGQQDHDHPSRWYRSRNMGRLPHPHPGLGRGGKKAGSNSSAVALFVPTLTADTAKVQEWEQHWVRGIAGGILDHRVRVRETTADGKPNNILRLYKTYTPSFVQFFAVDHDAPFELWLSTSTEEVGLQATPTHAQWNDGSLLNETSVDDVSAFPSPRLLPQTQV